MLVIGITGGTGVGKSTLLNVLKDKNACIIDCDAVYHDLLCSDKKMNERLAAEFPQVYNGEKIDTKALGSIVFNDESALIRLKKITHPRIVEAVKNILDEEAHAGRKTAAIDAYGLSESGLDRICDITVAVTAPEEMRIQRTMLRDSIDEEYARQRIRSQKSDKEYAAECDLELVNDCASLEEFTNKCEKFINNILEV